MMVLWARAAVVLACVVAVASVAAKPNILFLLTDDQDVMLGGLDPMPKVRKLLIEKGMTFTNAFVHTPICCPSRSSYMTGKYIHNGGAHNNSVAGNCQGADWVANNEKRTFAVAAQGAGYITSYAGKYMNQYALPGSPGCTGHNDPHCATPPPGWSYWAGLYGNSKYYDYSMSVDGKRVDHGSDYATDYFPDVVANRTLFFLQDTHAKHPDKPFLAVCAWPTPHGPHPPAPQYARVFDGYQAPRTPSYNLSSSFMQEKQWLMRQQDIITPRQALSIDGNFQQRWETLLSVDDHVERFVQELEATGRLANTYILYTSDHGFQLGQQRLPGDKRHLYENDIRMPFIVRGPGVPANKTCPSIVMNIDVAPTFTELATGAVPDYMDGRSFLPFLQGRGANVDWRTDFMVDYHGEHHLPCELQTCPPPEHPNFHENDGLNNTFSCVRTLSAQEDTMYCEFADAENFVEYYDVGSDPWERQNLAATTPKAKLAQYAARLEQFRQCDGKACRNI